MLIPNPFKLWDRLRAAFIDLGTRAPVVEPKWGRCQDLGFCDGPRYRNTLRHRSGDRSAVSNNGVYWFWEDTSEAVSWDEDAHLHDLVKKAEVFGFEEEAN